MARELTGVIHEAFHDLFRYNNSWSSHSWRNRNPAYNTTINYMEIPIDDDIFEVPLFAINTFIDIVKSNRDEEVNAIVATINSQGNIPRYKSVDRYMQDILLDDFSNSRLVKLEAKQGDDTVVYYGTCGAVFNKDFYPIMICSWQIERYLAEVVQEDESTDCAVMFKFLRPIIRVNPPTFMAKSDPIERFISNKLINAGLTITTEAPDQYHVGSRFSAGSWTDHRVKVEIDEMPFILKETDNPSISTTNQQLLQLAIDHIEEVIQ